MVLFQIDRKLHRICDGAAGVGGHQVRDQILLLADFFGLLVEALAEAVEVLNVRFSHHIQNVVDTMLGSNLELAADVIFDQLLHEGRVGVCDGIVVADAGADKDLFDPLDAAQLAQQLDIFGVVDVHVGTGLGSQTFAVLAKTILQLFFAGGIAEVCGWPAHVVDVSLEVRIAGHLLGFLKDGFLAAGDNLPSLMKGDGAEVAVAEASAILHDGEFDLLDGIDTAQLFIGRVVGAGKGQAEHLVQLLAGEGRHRRILDQILAVGLLLHDNLSVDSILPLVLNLVRLGVAFLVFCHLAEGGTGNAVGRDFILGAEIADAAEVPNLVQGFSGCHPVNQLADDLFAHAVQQQVGLSIHQNRRTHRIVPVIIVGKAAQRSLQTADDDVGIGEEPAQSLGINDGCPVGTTSCLAAGSIGILTAAALGGSVVCDHRVDVAAGDEEGIFRGAKFQIVTVADRLGDDADGITHRFDDTGDDCRAEAGVVDIGIADDIDKVELVPAALEGLFPCDG